jgi:secondary thiamine-phosphate synthase enzyme
MLTATEVQTQTERTSIIRHVVLSVETRRRVEFVDLTAAIAATIQGLALDDGVVIIQTRHTTTGILINEYEPLLLEDLEAMFERVAPADVDYRHDDFERRTTNIGPGERRNGHAHCRAALLHASESVPVAKGLLTLGRWQRVLFVEFDGAQRREVSLAIMGETRRLRSTMFLRSD